MAIEFRCVGDVILVVMYRLSELLGRTIEQVVVGWFRTSDQNCASRLFLRLDDGTVLEACTGSSFRLEVRSVPADFDVGRGMRYEFEPAEPDHPVAQLVGSQISRVQEVLWREWRAGIVVTAGNARVVVADEADEIYVDAEKLPVDYRDAALHDV